MKYSGMFRYIERDRYSSAAGWLVETDGNRRSLTKIGKPLTPDVLKMNHDKMKKNFRKELHDNGNLISKNIFFHELRYLNRRHDDFRRLLITNHVIIDFKSLVEKERTISLLFSVG